MRAGGRAPRRRAASTIMARAASLRTIIANVRLCCTVSLCNHLRNQTWLFRRRSRESRERELLAVIRDLVLELHPQRAKSMEISTSSRLERDLGIDSLGRTELILRVERAFGVRLSGSVAGAAETAGDLLRALEQAHPEPSVKTAEVRIAALPQVSAAVEARTLIEALEWHAAAHPERVHLTVIEDEATPIATFTYRGLAEAAREAAQGLIERDVMPGDRIALMLPTGRDFFVAFFAILYAGAVPVPIYPPMRLSQLEEHLRRQAGILGNAGARILITVPEARGAAALLQAQVESLTAVESVAGSFATRRGHAASGFRTRHRPRSFSTRREARAIRRAWF